MNFIKELDESDINLLKEIGIKVENKEYTKDDARMIENTVEEFIMSHSTKNNDISKCSEQYDNILSLLVNFQQNNK